MHRLAAPLASAVVALAPAAPATADLAPDWTLTRDVGPDFVHHGLAVDAAGSSYALSNVEIANDLEMVLTKHDADGGLLWETIFSGPVGQDLALDTILDATGTAVYVVGRSAVPGFGNSDYAIVKYDAATGHALWTRFHDGPVSGIDDPRAAAAMPDGGIVVTGGVWNDDERMDYGTVCFDADGTPTWSVTYGENGPFLFNEDRGEAVAVTADGDVIVSGTARPATSGNDVVTFRYDGRTGAQLWTARYATSANETLADIAMTPDGDVIVFGTDPFGLDRQWFAARYDGTTGAEEWVRLHDPGWDEHARTITIDGAGDVYLVGATDPDGDDSNFNENLVVVALAGPTGAVRWVAEFGDEGINDADFGFAAAADGQGSLFVTGTSRSDLIVTQPFDADAILLRYDAATGALLETGRVDGTEPGGQVRTDAFTAIGTDAAGRIFVGGASSGDVGVVPRLLLARFSGTGPTPQPADLDGDGTVGFSDLSMLLATWGTCPPPCPADIDGDGSVGFADLSILLGGWG